MPTMPACHCITCADEGIPMRVIELDRAQSIAVCSEKPGDTPTQEVAVDLLAHVAVGDEVLVHAGVALTRLGSPA